MVSMGTVPVKITKKQKEILDKLKKHPRETYADAFSRLCSKPKSKECRRLKNEG